MLMGGNWAITYNQTISSEWRKTKKNNDKQKIQKQSNTRSLALTTNTMMSMSSPNFSRKRRTVPEITDIKNIILKHIRELDTSLVQMWSNT